MRWDSTGQSHCRKPPARGDRVALQGNLDPSILLCKPDVIRQQASNTLNSFGQGDGHVFNLGHGITPNVNPDHLGALVKAVWK